MSAEIAATPDNFEAQLEASESAANDSPGFVDDGSPANDNGSNWRAELDSDADSGHPLNPHQSKELTEEGDGTDITDAQDTPREYEPEEEAQPQDDEQGGEDEQPQDGQPLTIEQYQQMHQELMSPNLPEGLLDRLVTVKENGREYEVPVSELTQGYMRMRNYSRGKAEQAEAIRTAQNITQNMRGLVDSWRKDPEAFRGGIKKLGLERAFDAAVMKRAVEMHEVIQMNPEQRALYDQRNEIERERERLAYEKQQLERAKPNPVDQYRPQVEAYVAQTVPALFEQYQIRQSPIAMGYMAQNFQTLWNGQQDTLQQAMQDAAHATAQDLAFDAEQHAAHNQQPANNNSGMPPRQRQQRQPQALGPRRLPGGAAPPQQGGNGRRGTPQGGGNPNDFDAWINRGPGR